MHRFIAQQVLPNVNQDLGSYCKPLGNWHRSQSSATACPIPGVYLLGLWTTVLPVNSAAHV